MGEPGGGVDGNPVVAMRLAVGPGMDSLAEEGPQRFPSLS